MADKSRAQQAPSLVTEPGEHVAGHSSLSNLMAAIQTCRTELVTKVGSMAIDENLLRMDLHGVADRVMSTENQLEVLQQEVTALCETIASLQKLSVQLQDHVEDSEQRSRRNNLRLVGFS
ncbi:hypothetical protein NDU88_008851 [Pleurodeles waltl]|uniref:Uncharacterized protein n=1 Tax=Pleurodeles waltl TaxID=8319 RepID=A0AAV7NYZ0_PLEWA|nr:hypothetical protein NDU88_008851 [Pleurodeles waltl]